MIRRVLLVTHGSFLARNRVVTGNSVRAYYLTRGLLEHGMSVVYAFPRELDPEEPAEKPPGVEIRSFGSDRELQELVRGANPDAVLVGYWELLERLPEELSVPVIADLLAPRVLETRFEGRTALDLEVRRMALAYRKADRFLVGSERQRHFLLPWLLMAGFDCREEVPVDVVPISAAPGAARRIEDESHAWQLVTGGVDWPWRRSREYLANIAQVLVRGEAMRGTLWWPSGGYLYQPHAEVGRPEQPEWPAVKTLPLLSYGDMEALFARCDIGLELAERNVEREYSLSFRSIDYLRCGLPVICNDYLELAQHVREYGAGWTVSDPGQLPELLAGIAAAPKDYAQRSEGAIRLVAERFHYRSTVAPLVKYLQAPRSPRRRRSPFLQQSRELHRLHIRLRERSALLQERDGTLATLSGQLLEREERIADLRGEVTATRDTVAAGERRLQRLEEERGRLEEERGRLEEERGRLEEEQRRLRDILQGREGELAAARARTQELLSSHSWRVTAPLRAVHLGLRGVAGWLRRPTVRRPSSAPRRKSLWARGASDLREAWKTPQPAPPSGDGAPAPAQGGCVDSVGVLRALFYPWLVGRQGNHIAIVTRKDVYPTNHGAAVKIERTAWGESYHADSVFLVTGDWSRYYLFRQGRASACYYPRLVRVSGVLALRAVRRLQRIGVPDNEAVFYHPLFDWSYFLRLAYVSWRHRIRLYQAEFPGYAKPCLWARRLFGGRTLLVEHNVEYARIADQYPDTPEAARAWLKQAEVALCNRVDHVVAVSDPDRRLLVDSGVDPGRLVVIPHGVDLSLYERSYDFDVRQQYGLQGRRPVVVYHGIYSYAPNLEAVHIIARELLPRLRAHGMRAAVVAIGPHAPEQTVDEDVVFTGSVDNLAPYLKSVDLAVVPLQKGGGTRMKILEYFAAGVPVVATSKAVEGIPLQDGVHARIEDDFDAMAAAVMQLLADAEGRKRLVENAGSLVKDLDWRVIVRRYLDLVGWDGEVDHPRAAEAH